MAGALSAGVSQIFSNYYAFAALKEDGSVVTWGHAAFGGDSGSVATQLNSGVSQVFSTLDAFAALKEDGSVVTWGDSGRGGDSTGVAGALNAGVVAFANSFTDDVFDPPTVNVVPTLDAVSELTILENDLEQTVPLTGITAGGGESQPLSVTASSSNPGLIDPTVTYTSPNATGSLAFTPAPDQSGTATITVTVEDGGLDGNLNTPGDNATFSRTFDVTVNPVNPVNDSPDSLVSY